MGRSSLPPGAEILAVPAAAEAPEPGYHSGNSKPTIASMRKATCDPLQPFSFSSLMNVLYVLSSLQNETSSESLSMTITEQRGLSVTDRKQLAAVIGKKMPAFCS